MSEKKVELSIKGKKKKPSNILKLKLYLKQDGDEIILKGYDEANVNWNIIAITTDGKFKRIKSIPNDIGLRVNRNRQILEAK